MHRRLRALLLAAAILVVAYAVILIAAPGTRPWEVVSAARPYRDRAPARPAEEDPGTYEEVVVTVQLPARGEPLSTIPGGAHGPNCPTTKVSSILGVAITNPHGIRIGAVVPEGPAAKAGIKRGDRIVKCGGRSMDCPRTLLPYLGLGEEQRSVELTLRRPAAAAGEGADAEPAGG